MRGSSMAVRTEPQNQAGRGRNAGRNAARSASTRAGQTRNAKRDAGNRKANPQAGGAPRTDPPVDPQVDPPVDAPAGAAISAIQGANPFVGLSRTQLVAALGRWGGRLLREPTVAAARAAGVASEDLRILAGVSKVDADPKDKRFADPAWDGPVWRRGKQG